MWMARSAGLLRALLRASIIGLVALAAAPQLASAQTPSQEQLDAFQNLTPEQQRAVLEAMQNGDTATEGEERTTEPTDEARRDRSQTPGARDKRSATGVGVTLPKEPPRAKPGATVVLKVTSNTNLPLGDERTRIEGRRDQILRDNPYELDEEGRLHLPLLAPVPLGGLTEAEAALRLNTDPRLMNLQFIVKLLLVDKVGPEALRPFGYDLFKEGGERFAPGQDLAVGADYVVAPGDHINVDLFGKKTGRYRLTVSRDGALTLPELGPIQVSGLSFDDVREEIERRVSDQLIGVRASVTMGQLRSLRVFVVGDVTDPGSHRVPSQSTITGALFASGGVSEAGSLRNIELKRRGATVARFDLYDLLLKGDTSRDLQLEQGDAIFVAPLGATAGVAGQVRRPAIYELRTGATVGDLLDLAGGLRADAAHGAAKLQRIEASGDRTVLDLDVAAAADRGRPLRTGDTLIVPKVLDEYAGGVTLEGHVQRPGPYAWKAGMRLTDLLGGLELLKINADQRYIVIRREVMPDRHVEVVSADAVAAFAAKGGAADPLLERRDRVIVFSRSADRGTTLTSLLDELRLQNRDNRPDPIVTVGGRVRAPGDYPYERDMTASDLVRAGGGLDDAAYATTAELTRYEVIDGERRQTEVIDLDLRAMREAGPSADVRVQPYDVLVIKEVPDWREQESVSVRGEVRFPGNYPIRRGETLSSLITRAGGLTESAFAAGSVFMRQEIKVQEREQVETLANRLQSDLTLLALQGSQTKDQNAAETLTAGQSLLQQLRSAEPKGRLVVNLDKAVRNPNSEDDIQLRDQDVLLIPRYRQYVTVIGEVQNPTSHVWKSEFGRQDYIAMSGGLSRRADEDRVYVVRANGSVVTEGGHSWFRSGGGATLEPGSTVVVPIDAERMRPLPLWTAVTTIIYNLAIAAAAVNSF
jgi:protein involved in polysaccharide export with SLBB domain